MFTRTRYAAFFLAFAAICANLSGTALAATAAGINAAAGAAVAASGSISGVVKDTGGAVLKGAQVVLQPTAAANDQGNFVIPNLKPGQYTVTVSYVGFSNAVSTVTVIAGQVTQLNPVLNVGSANQQVTVNGTLNGDAAAINEQRTSANILNVETDQEIQSLPNANIADALGRLPGVTLQRNEVEGQYVQIRGTEPRLSNTTIDGVIVPGPDPDVRQVDLDTIPADLVGSVAINKTLSANQDGDAIGGSVDMRIKQATRNEPGFSIEGMGASMSLMPASRISFTSLSSSVRLARSTRPSAWLEFAHRILMFSSESARPNWVMPWTTRKTECLSE